MTSLDQSPVDKAHVSVLFYLAETVLYWLRTDVAHVKYLRPGELKILQIGRIVFLRLYFYHIVGELREYGELRARLSTYLEGFALSFFSNFSSKHDLGIVHKTIGAAICFA